MLEDSLLFSDDLIQCQRVGDNIWLMLAGDEEKGAVTPALGASLLKALTSITHSHANAPARVLHVSIGNSAGADIQHPMESLHDINDILESLWKLHAQGLRIHVTIDEGCYGGAAILFAACADEFLLGDQSTVSLLGPRVLKALDPETPWPVHVPGTDIVGNNEIRIKRIAFPA